MATSLVSLGKIPNLAPGQSKTKRWNNATPHLAVWFIQAIPQNSSFTTFPPAEESVEVEVTRVWRKLNRTVQGAFLGGTHSDFEHEIWYEVKNVGGREVDVEVYASITT